MIGTLEKKGLAYTAANGDVYFSVRDFPGYGKLSRRNLDDLRAGERVAVDVGKRDPARLRAVEGTPSRASPRGPRSLATGRPGWHIECSAMSRRSSAPRSTSTAADGTCSFPHHENEIAQSEGALGHRFADYWMHAAFLNIDAEKMSKSLGNFFTTREVLDKLDAVQGGEQLRFFLLRAHYRSEINYTWDTLADAGNTLRGFYTALREVPPRPRLAIDWSNPYAARFRDAMNDDFDTPIAFAVLHDLRGEVNRTKSRELSGLLKALGGTVGLLQADPEAFLKGAASAVDVQALVDARKAAKKRRTTRRPMRSARKSRPRDS